MKSMAFRTLFALAAFFDLDIDQMDVKTAFLYGLIDQLIYMEIPKGTETEATKNMFCKLLKAIYGLKQSPRLWYERFLAFLLKKLGLKRIHADHSIFVSGAGLKGPILSVFVDDIKIGAKGQWDNQASQSRTHSCILYVRYGSHQLLPRIENRSGSKATNHQTVSTGLHRKSVGEIPS